MANCHKIVKKIWFLQVYYDVICSILNCVWCGGDTGSTGEVSQVEIIFFLKFQTTHTYGKCILWYVDSFLKYEKSIALVLAGLYCASFVLCISQLATHFIYRYIAICRPEDLSQLQGVRLLRLYILPIIFSIVWYFVVTVLVAPTARKDEYMRESINEAYGEDISRLSYLGVLYFYKNESSGKTVIGWPDFTFSACACGIMQTCIITMVICGWKTCRKLGSLEGSMSKKTKELNVQLFRTLVLQTLIPLCTMFAPLGIVIVLPMFSITVGKLENIPSLYAGFYPALDALVVIFMTRDFRNTVLCRKAEVSIITPATQNPSNYVNGDQHGNQFLRSGRHTGPG
ncbi:hypothetical protein GCK72_020825 [Caenorhabditis remanei]|uniref:Seven TM Receptor n=1 Tax=Caenorhabditis remanei TaxID=31234 RepID=A0A6A5GI83_CAERE|nr:hypothetical protein GCK72_020825 [Caenorhabditis remanei]KAF1754265.1 hypothetical protein GCK72_020825 [Caenorhabditis remanei]